MKKVTALTLKQEDGKIRLQKVTYEKDGIEENDFLDGDISTFKNEGEVKSFIVARLSLIGCKVDPENVEVI